jgi:hypothetical protein
VLDHLDSLREVVVADETGFTKTGTTAKVVRVGRSRWSVKETGRTDDGATKPEPGEAIPAATHQISQTKATRMPRCGKLLVSRLLRWASGR